MARDLNDLLREKGEDAVRERLDRNRTPHAPKGGAEFSGSDRESNRNFGPKAQPKVVPFPIKPYRDFPVHARKEWQVRNMLGAGELSVFFGEPGSGKSVLIGDLLLHAAAGLPWQGLETRPGLAVFVALERPALVERRALAFRIRTGLSDIPFALVRGPINFTDPQTAPAILATIKQAEDEFGQPLVLLALDTVSAGLCGGDENSSRDMGALVATMNAIQAGVPTAHMLAAHHTPHDAARLRGHGALLGAADVTVEVNRKDHGIRSASVRKSNDGEEGLQIHFRLEGVTIDEDEVGNKTTAPLVVATEALSQQSSKPAPRLTASAKIALLALDEAILDQGKEPPASNTIPNGVKAVTIEQWRDFAYRRGIASSEKQRARQAAFRRALEALAASKLIGISEPFVWSSR